MAWVFAAPVRLRPRARDADVHQFRLSDRCRRAAALCLSAFAVVTFELTVLFGALLPAIRHAAAQWLAASALPGVCRLAFHLASKDRFFLCIKAQDQRFDPQGRGYSWTRSALIRSRWCRHETRASSLRWSCVATGRLRSDSWMSQPKYREYEPAAALSQRPRPAGAGGRHGRARQPELRACAERHETSVDAEPARAWPTSNSTSSVRLVMTGSATATA